MLVKFKEYLLNDPVLLRSTTDKKLSYAVSQGVRDCSWTGKRHEETFWSDEKWSMCTLA